MTTKECCWQIAGTNVAHSVKWSFVTPIVFSVAVLFSACKDNSRPGYVIPTQKLSAQQEEVLRMLLIDIYKEAIPLQENQRIFGVSEFYLDPRSEKKLESKIKTISLGSGFIRASEQDVRRQIGRVADDKVIGYNLPNGSGEMLMLEHYTIEFLSTGDGVMAPDMTTVTIVPTHVRMMPAIKSF